MKRKKQTVAKGRFEAANRRIDQLQTIIKALENDKAYMTGKLERSEGDHKAVISQLRDFQAQVAEWDRLRQGFRKWLGLIG